MQQEVRTEYILPPIPTELLPRYVPPEWKGKTNKDMANYILVLLQIIDQADSNTLLVRDLLTTYEDEFARAEIK